MKLKKLIGIMTMTTVVAISSLMPALAVDHGIQIQNVQLNPTTRVMADEECLPGATHYTAVQFSSMSRKGEYYLGFEKRRADGTYGNSTAQKALLSNLTMTKLYTFELNGGYYKEYVIGDSAIGYIKSVRLRNTVK